MLASIIIPSHNRNKLVNRAYKSVLSQTGSNLVEVIIVDDCSDPILIVDDLRYQDKIIRLETNSGGAVARNAGLDIAKGEIIYFLDSDDIFVERNYLKDRSTIGDSDDLFYCSSMANFKYLMSPLIVSPESYFESIFMLYPGVANTCSIVFKNKACIRFDPDMPKHQDWEFVYSNFVSKSKYLYKIDGIINIDRSDRKSTSRIRKYERSLPWLRKLRHCLSDDMFLFAEYHILGDYPEYMNWFDFCRYSVKLLFARKNSFFVICKKTIQRIIL